MVCQGGVVASSETLHAGDSTTIVVQVSVVNDDQMDVCERLESLKSLEDGWASGTQLARQWDAAYSKAPDSEGLDWLAAQFTQFYPDTLPRPYIYPTPEGGVQIEWPLGEQEASLEIDLRTHSAEWQCLDFGTSATVDRTLGLDTPASWKWLTEQLAGLEKAAR